MSDKIFAFAVPLATLEPGLTDDQLVHRRADAWRLIRSLMPSASALSGSMLVDRIEGRDGRLWLACDLIESRQRSLLDAVDPSIYRLAGAAIARLKLEVNRLRREARDSVLRFGEVASLAASMADGASETLEMLTEQDQLRLEVMANGRGARVEILVGGDLIQYQLPSLPTYTRGAAPRRVVAKVEWSGRMSARVVVREGIAEVDLRHRGKQTLQLLRTSPIGARCAHWPAISIASGTGVMVNMTVREARHLGRDKLSHIELMAVENATEIIAAAGYRPIGTCRST